MAGSSRKRTNRKTLILLLALFIVAGIIWLIIEGRGSSDAIPPVGDGECEIIMIDVGQGDALLIRTKDDNMLIDTGPYTSVAKLEAFLKKAGIKTLDCVVFTHPHEDHVGGGETVIRDFEVGAVMLPDSTSSTQAYIRLLELIKEKNIPVTVPNAGDKYDFGEIKLTVLSAESESKADDLNSTSIVLRADYKNTSALFTGDAPRRIEKEIMERYGDLVDCDVLKVGHHGSSNSSDPDFLRAVSPVAALISCEKGNSYGHPYASTLRSLEEVGAVIYRTDIDSTVTLFSDGEHIWKRDLIKSMPVNGG